MTFEVVDLFAGIGGFSLGLDWSGGFRTVAFCEQDRFCQRVLAKHWPGVPIHDDIRTFKPPACDVITGGFPCQDISLAGTGAGLGGARSSLWFEMLRCIDEARPRWVIAENVPALRSRGLDRVLGGLMEIGYGVEWHCVPASALGARHRRDRIWIVAYAYGDDGSRARRPPFIQRAILDETRWWKASDGSQTGRVGSNAPDAHSGGRQAWDWAEPDTPEIARVARGYGWETEPSVARVVDGLPKQSHRNRALGNAVVPQVVEMFGRAIMKYTEVQHDPDCAEETDLG